MRDDLAAVIDFEVFVVLVWLVWFLKFEED